MFLPPYSFRSPHCKWFVDLSPTTTPLLFMSELCWLVHKCIKILLNSAQLPVRKEWRFCSGPGWNWPCQFKLMGDREGDQGRKESNSSVWFPLHPKLLLWAVWQWFCVIVSSVQLTKWGMAGELSYLLKNNKHIKKPLFFFFCMWTLLRGAEGFLNVNIPLSDCIKAICFHVILATSWLYELCISPFKLWS